MRKKVFPHICHTTVRHLFFNLVNILCLIKQRCDFFKIIAIFSHISPSNICVFAGFLNSGFYRDPSITETDLIPEIIFKTILKFSTQYIVNRQSGRFRQISVFVR